MGSFPLAIHLYGFLVGAGILAGFWVATRVARNFEFRISNFEFSPNDVWGSLWWVVIPAVVGARIYHVVDFWEYYREHLILIPALWMGGLGIFGGIAGGVFGLWMYCWWECFGEFVGSGNRNFLDHRRLGSEKSSQMTSLPGIEPGLSGLRKLVSLALLSWRKCLYTKRFFIFLDLAAFGLPIGQAIGRWGNYFNQELYGEPTDFPWGISINPVLRPEGFEQYTRFHPLFLYESVFALLVFTVLWFLWRRKGTMLRAGSYFFVYLILYGGGRFWLEGLRIKPWAVLGVPMAQVISVISLLSGAVLLYSFNNKRMNEKH